MIGPARLGDISAAGLDIFGYCNSCHRNRVIDSGGLLVRLGPSYPVPKIGRRMKCQDCGGQDIYTRPNWVAVAGYHYPAI